MPTADGSIRRHLHINSLRRHPIWRTIANFRRNRPTRPTSHDFFIVNTVDSIMYVICPERVSDPSFVKNHRSLEQLPVDSNQESESNVIITRALSRLLFVCKSANSSQSNSKFSIVFPDETRKSSGKLKPFMRLEWHLTRPNYLLTM